jgi:hypothetical protein
MEEKGVDNFIRRLGGWGFIIVVLIIAFYSTFYIVDWRKNIHTTPTLDEYNNTVNKTVYYYDTYDYVPVKVIGKNTINTHWSMWNVFVIVIVLFLYQLFAGGAKQSGLLPAEYMRKMIRKEMKNRNDVEEYHVMDETYLQLRRYDSQEPKPIKRFVFAEVKLNNQSSVLNQGFNVWMYVFDPYTAYEIDRVSLEKIPEGFRPKCENCGDFPDERVITPEAFKLMKEMGMGLKSK